MASPTPLSLDFITVDVFTTSKFAGNPLAIILIPSHLRSSLRQATKQLLAREFNLSESVFLHLPPPPSSSPSEPSDQPDHAPPTTYDLDIFTTDAELPFAGHPTIGTASYLLQHIDPSATALRTKAGLIPVSLTPTGAVLARIPHDVHVHAQTLTSLWERGKEAHSTTAGGFHASLPSSVVEAALSDDPAQNILVAGDPFDPYSARLAWAGEWPGLPGGL